MTDFVEHDWSNIRSILDDLYPNDTPYEISQDNAQLFVYIGDFLQAIFQKLSKDNELTFHVRASLPPDTGLKLYSLFADRGIKAKIGSVFEIDKQGKFLHDVDALRLVANNIYPLWFGEPHPAIKKALESIKEAREAHKKATQERYPESEGMEPSLPSKKYLLN